MIIYYYIDVMYYDDPILKCTQKLTLICRQWWCIHDLCRRNAAGELRRSFHGVRHARRLARRSGLHVQSDRLCDDWQRQRPHGSHGWELVIPVSDSLTCTDQHHPATMNSLPCYFVTSWRLNYTLFIYLFIIKSYTEYNLNRKSRSEHRKIQKVIQN